MRLMQSSAGTEPEQTSIGLIDVVDGRDGLVLVADRTDQQTFSNYLLASRSIPVVRAGHRPMRVC
jgi:hypothetical protein